jgi:hypothetical protein
MRYAWVVTSSWIEDENGAEFGKETKVFVSGPRNASAAMTALAVTSGYPFKMYDDDGIKYYEGKCWTADPEGFGGEEFFGPLNDYGAPNAGCTEIKYPANGKTGKYEIL